MSEAGILREEQAALAEVIADREGARREAPASAIPALPRNRFRATLTADGLELGGTGIDRGRGP